MKTKTIFLLIVSLIAIIAAFCKGPESVSSSLPDVTLLDLSGKQVNLRNFAGKGVIVNFWATWCGPCRAEIPMLNDLYKKYKDHGLEIVGISTDEEGAPVVKEFVKEIPINYNNYLKSGNTEEEFGGIWAYPTSFFYDKNGKRVDMILGLQTREYFEKNIQQILKD